MRVPAPAPAAPAALALMLGIGLATPAAAQQTETGAFTIRQHDVTIGTERFERTAASLAAELTLVDQATLQIRAALDPDATARRLDVRVFGPGGATGEPIQTSAVSFEGDTARFEQPIGTPVGEPRHVPDDAVAYVSPSPSFLEQILRRARVIGGDTVAVTVWSPAPGGGETRQATVAFAADSATLSLGGVTIEAVTDGYARILSARVPSQGVTIRRQ